MKRPRDATVVLNRQDDLRGYRCLGRLSEIPAQDEHGVPVSTAGLEHASDTFIDEELQPPAREVLSSRPFASTGTGGATGRLFRQLSSS